GADNTGGGVSFSQPQLISTDIGCSNPDSVVLTPLGLFFQSPHGVYLLGRNLTTSFIGENTSNTLISNITAALPDPLYHQILFLAGNIIYVYDYTTDAWGQWQVNSSGGVSSMTAWGTVLTICSSTGVVSSQNQSSYSDMDGTYALYIEIGNIRLDQAVTGFARVRGCNIQWVSSTGGNGITVTVRYDYGEASGTSIATGQVLSEVILNSGQDDFECRFANQKAKAVSLVMQETTIGSDLMLDGITFQIGIEGGLNRKPASRRAH